MGDKLGVFIKKNIHTYVLHIYLKIFPYFGKTKCGVKYRFLTICRLKF